MANMSYATFSSLEAMPELSFPQEAKALKNDWVCYSLWRKYHMPENIVRHSKLVASIAYELAVLCQKKGSSVNPDLVRQSALLHDLGKLYSLKYGGSHAMIGAAWVVAETGNYELAQGVMHHVYWPWAVPEGEGIASLPLLVLYADKRARHDECVTLEERFSDLLDRYGKTEKARASMQAGFEQHRAIEKALSNYLGWEDLHAHTFDRRRMVN